jgi:hypothetical protein
MLNKKKEEGKEEGREKEKRDSLSIPGSAH